MAQITSKELGGISDQMAIEKNLISKYQCYAKNATDGELKKMFETNARKHQNHLNDLYANLK